jgi:hypothetical protein
MMMMMMIFFFFFSFFTAVLKVPSQQVQRIQMQMQSESRQSAYTSISEHE